MMSRTLRNKQWFELPLDTELVEETLNVGKGGETG